MAPKPRLSVAGLLVAAAGRILPAARRADWVREWNAELWHAERSGSVSDRTLLTRALGAFADASFLLRQEHEIGIRLREMRSSRFGSVAVLVVVAAILAFATRGFQSGRALLLNRESDRIFLLSQPSPFMGSGARVPPPQAAAWIANGRTAESLGRWWVSAGSRCVADRTAVALFSETQMKPDCEAISLAPGVIAGFSGLIGRLKPGYTFADAEKELAATAELGVGWLRPAIVPVTQLHKAPLVPIGGALLLLVVFNVFGLRNCSMEAWGWGLSRIALSFGIVAGLWLEIVARAPFTEAGSIPGLSAMGSYFFPAIAATLIALRLRRDVQRRCRTCYRLLSMPVFVGFSGRCLFDSGGIEYLCSAHHGALLTGSVPGQSVAEEWSQWPGTCA
jgi:hypothetical protein